VILASVWVMLKYCLTKKYNIMKQVSVKPSISLEKAEEHYQLSSENYTIESAESHLAYYREKHPLYYDVLLNSV
jgi:hypothetical protein